MGIDFMTLLTEEEPVDSAIETDDDDPVSKLQRRFSRQRSAAPDIKDRTTSFQRTPSVRRRNERNESFLSRQGSISYKERKVMRSDLSITQDAEEVEIFVSTYSKCYFCRVIMRKYDLLD